MSRFLQTSVLVHGRQTELVVQPFGDRILVLITQMGKVGSLIQASIPSTASLHAHALSSVSGPQASPTLPCPPLGLQLTPILGSAPSVHMHILHSLYAAQIATLLWLTIGGEPRSVIVGVALLGTKGRMEGEELDDEERQTFLAVMGALQTKLSTNA